jgi:hypothetical protein
VQYGMETSLSPSRQTAAINHALRRRRKAVSAFVEHQLVPITTHGDDLRGSGELTDLLPHTRDVDNNRQIIHEVFKRNVRAADIGAALEELAECGLITSRQAPGAETGGRPATLWSAL